MHPGTSPVAVDPFGPVHANAPHGKTRRSGDSVVSSGSRWFPIGSGRAFTNVTWSATGTLRKRRSQG